MAMTLVSAPAWAQQDATGFDDADGVILVTGSRISRPDLESASPVAVVGAEEIGLQAGSSNIENVLNDLPQVVATTSSTSNNPGGGVATVNLRGLGSARTLVLVDGRRYVSYDVSQIVDLNTVPSALVERVEVLTGGRSAVYGSDAIAGVVNFVLRRDFEGFEVNSQYNITERGDGQIWDINGTIGTNFADGRGNVTLHAGYVKRKATYAGEREFSRRAMQDNQDGTFIYGGSSSVPQLRIQDARLSAITGAANNDFGPDGSITPYVATEDAYNFAPANYLQVPQERFLVSAMASYEVSPAFRPYLEGQFINNRVVNELAATPIGNSTPFGEGSLGALQIQTSSPFLAPALQAQLAALDAAETGPTAGDGYITVGNWGYRTLGIGSRANLDKRNAYRIVAGLEGELGGGFEYDAYYMYANTDNSQRQLGNIAISNFVAATTTAFENPTTGAISPFPFAGVAGGGELVCADATARAAGCVPANIFGLGNLSQEAANYLSIGATNLETYTTQVASAVITNGDLFDLGAGGIGVALGAEWRSESGEVTPDTYLASGNVAGFNPGQPTGGSYDLYEFFGEVNVPLIRDSFIHLLELNGSARLSNYSNAPGEVFSWAAGGVLAPFEGLTFRGQYQKAIRGPSVSELFLGNTVSFEGNIDVCGTAAATSGELREVCLAQGVPAARIGDPTLGNPNSSNPPTFLGGNPDLTEEKATTWTVGAVFQPSFAPRFSVTVDYYNIEIDDYISTVGTENIGTACFELFLDDYCGLISRDSTGEIQRIDDLNFNSGGVKTEGIDITAGYGVPLGTFLGAEDANLSFNFAGTRILNFDFLPVAGLPIVNDCEGKFGAICGANVPGQPLPKWRHSLRTTFGFDAMSLSVQWRHIGSVVDDDPNTTYFAERFDAMNYIDLTFTADVAERIRLNLGVSNLFDKEPPLAASGQQLGNGEQSNTYPTTYDVLGRSFFVSASVRF